MFIGHAWLFFSRCFFFPFEKNTHACSSDMRVILPYTGCRYGRRGMLGKRGSCRRCGSVVIVVLGVVDVVGKLGKRMCGRRGRQRR